MSVRRWTALVLGALLTFGGLSLAAETAQADTCPVVAGQYPPGVCDAAVSASAVAQGASVTVSGDGFPAGATVVFRLSGGFFLGTAVADSTGHVALTVRIPGSAALGRHAITLSGGGTVVTTSVRVVSNANGDVVTSGNTSGTASGSSAGGLATTGANNLVPLAGGGAALVALGAMTLFVVRRRRTETAAT